MSEYTVPIHDADVGSKSIGAPVVDSATFNVVDNGQVLDFNTPEFRDSTWDGQEHYADVMAGRGASLDGS